MADIVLKPKSPLNGLDVSIGTIRLSEVTDVSIISVAIRSGEEDAFAKSLKALFGIEMPKPAYSTSANSVRAVRGAPDQVILFFDESDAFKEDDTFEKLRNMGYVSVQTDAWVLLDISGNQVTDALERICPIDIHMSTFPTGAFARTTMEHLGAGILRTGETSFLLMSASSSAGSFRDAVVESIEHITQT